MEEHYTVNVEEEVHHFLKNGEANKAGRHFPAALKNHKMTSYDHGDKAIGLLPEGWQRV